jgi:hypothetical protein
MSGADSDNSDQSFKEEMLENNDDNDPTLNISSPPLYSTDDYKIDSMQFTP